MKVFFFYRVRHMKLDYIIVGLGIAGLTYSKQLLDNAKSFMVIADGAAKATQTSGGVFNPIVLRRFTAPEDTLTYISYAMKTYEELQSIIGSSWYYPEQEVCRVFASLEEQNNWFIASDKPHLQNFVYPKVLQNTNPSIVADFGLGRVKGSFKIDPLALIHSYEKYLMSNDKMIKEKFDYTLLKETEGDYAYQYKNLQAKKVLFAEGADVSNNTFLERAFITPNKGEYLIIHSKSLQLNYMLKGGVYVIPLGEDLYKVGATYSPNDSSANPTEEAREEIEAKLQKMITCEYKVVDHVTGVRPVTKDLQPVLSKVKEGMYVYNGLGTRGFTRGPLYSKLLYDAIENAIPIPTNMSLERFEPKA